MDIAKLSSLSCDQSIAIWGKDCCDNRNRIAIRIKSSNRCLQSYRLRYKPGDEPDYDAYVPKTDPKAHPLHFQETEGR